MLFLTNDGTPYATRTNYRKMNTTTEQFSGSADCTERNSKISFGTTTMATKDAPSLQSGLESAYRRQQWPPNLMKNYSFIPRRHAYSSLKTCRALIVTSSRIGHTTLSSSSSSPHRLSCIDFLVSYLVGIVCERCDLFCQTVQCHHV